MIHHGSFKLGLRLQVVEDFNDFHMSSFFIESQDLKKGATAAKLGDTWDVKLRGLKERERVGRRVRVAQEMAPKAVATAYTGQVGRHWDGLSPSR